MFTRKFTFMSKNKYIAHQPLSTKIYVQFVMYADKV